MAGWVVAGLATLAAAALAGCSSVDSDIHIGVPYSGGGPTSFLQMSGSAYIIDATYMGETSIESVGNDVGLIVEVDHPEFLGDDSPGVQEPPPVIATGDEIIVITSRFPDGVDLARGEGVVLIVAHNSNFDPPWITTAIGTGTGPSFGLVGDDTNLLMVELETVAKALDVDLETAFVTIGRELLASDELMREGSNRNDSLGPALRAASGQAQSATQATSPEALWEASDPLTRALQRGTAPDELLDTLPELSVVYTISGHVPDANPGSSVQVRNNLGVTSSIDAALFHGTDTLFGSPGNPFEITLVVEDPARAMLIGNIAAIRWENAYAISVKVSLDPNGQPVATAEPMTRAEFATAIGG